MNPVIPLVLATVALLALDGSRAQVLVVDAAGGPGSQYTDLPPAVAAAPDGAVLRVRPGLYSQFTVAGKGLAIIGEDRSQVRIRLDSLLGFGATRPHQEVLLAHVRIESAMQWFDPALFALLDVQGPAILDDVEFASTQGGRYQLLLVDCEQVHVMRSTLNPAYGYWQGPAMIQASRSRVELCETSVIATPGPRGMRAGAGIELESSELFLVDSRIAGGAGEASGCGITGGTGGAGSVGILVGPGSSLIATGRNSSIQGGEGGRGDDRCGWNAPGDGGDGLVVSGTVRVYGFRPQGGAGGSYPPPGGLPGAAVSGSGSWQVDAQAHPPVATLRGTPVPGAVVQIDVDAPGGALVLLLLGYHPTYVPLEPLVTGPLTCLFDLTYGPSTVPPAGGLVLPLALPPSWPVLDAIHGQLLVLESGAQSLWASNGWVILAL